MNIFEHLEVVFSERRGEAIKKNRQFREYVLKERELIQSFRKV